MKGPHQSFSRYTALERWKFETWKYPTFWIFSSSEAAKIELEGEHTDLKLNVKKKASEGQNRLLSQTLVDRQQIWLSLESFMLQ